MSTEETAQNARLGPIALPHEERMKLAEDLGGQIFKPILTFYERLTKAETLIKEQALQLSAMEFSISMMLSNDGKPSQDPPSTQNISV